MATRRLRTCAKVVLALAAGLPASTARAEAPAQAQTPARELSLGDAVRLARTRGFEVLLAATQVRAAEADVTTAGASPNPLASGNVGWTLSCAGKCASGSPWGWGAGIADQGLVEGALTRKRALRRRVAERALEAARHDRADAERLLVAEVKIQYVQTASTANKLDFARDVAAALARSVEVERVRFPRVIDEGQLARIEQEALKAEQQVDRAARDLREQQIELALLLGTTGPIPALAVDESSVRFRVPEVLASTSKETMIRLALDQRPDRRAALAREAQGDAQIALARRQRFPDVSLSAQYSQQGTRDYDSQLPTLTVGASVPIPLLYRNEGEIRRAEADRAAAAEQRRRTDAVLSADVESSYNAFVTARAIVERYESGLLERAKRARDVTEVQFSAGSTRLTDLLDAERSFVQVNMDYQDELVSYWTAVFRLEQAIGKELVQ
jgi:cobalt-zinc-cadmium efflux system outer membrane protein